MKICWNEVQYLLQMQLETGTNINRKKAGVPKMTTAAEVKHLIIKRKRHERKTVPGLTVELNSSRQQPVSLSTVKNWFWSVGAQVMWSHQETVYGRWISRKKLWCNRYKNCTIEECQNVLWTEEFKFEHCCERRMYVRKKIGERLTNACVVPTVKHGVEPVMVLEWFEREWGLEICFQ